MNCSAELEICNLFRFSVMLHAHKNVHRQRRVMFLVKINGIWDIHTWQRRMYASCRIKSHGKGQNAAR